MRSVRKYHQAHPEPWRRHLAIENQSIPLLPSPTFPTLQCGPRQLLNTVEHDITLFDDLFVLGIFEIRSVRRHRLVHLVDHAVQTARCDEAGEFTDRRERSQ